MLFALLVLFVAVFMGWYRLRLRPRRWTKELISQGATLTPMEKDPSDSMYGIKKLIQKKPDTKAIIGQFPGRLGLFIFDTELIKEVLTNHKYYSKLNSENELSLLINARGITKAEGDDWKLHRRIISEAFQYDLFNGMVPVILDGANEILNLSDKTPRTLLLPNDIELVTSDAVTRIFFGLRSKDLIINGKPASEEATQIIRKNAEFSKRGIQLLLGNWPMNLSSSYRKHKKRILNFRNVFRQKIQERMQQIQSQEHQEKKKTDLLEILLQHRIKHNNDLTQTLSDEEILDEFAVFFLAGKDTTSLLVSMALYCCVTYPEWGEKLIKEIHEHVGDLKELNVESLNTMNVMTAFLSEVLRMYPPAPALLMRTANCDHYIGKMFVRKGYIVNTIFLANNYSPKYFKDPDHFDPNRWMKTEDKDEGTKNPFAYIPFSAGQRNCIGKHMALIEAKLIICSILKNYKISLDDGFKLKMGSHSIGYGPAEPIPLKLTPLSFYEK